MKKDAYVYFHIFDIYIYIFICVYTWYLIKINGKLVAFSYVSVGIIANNSAIQ